MKLIGVYGSLKHGFYNHSKLGADAVFKGQWYMRGRAYLVSSAYPELVVDEHGPIQTLELYEVSDDRFDMIDAMEAGAGYHRHVVQAGGLDIDGELVDVLVWVVDKPSSGAKPIDKYDATTAPRAVIDPRIIQNIDHLDKILSDHEYHEFKMALNGSMFTRKTIRLQKNGVYRIENGIDGSVQKLNKVDLFNREHTLVGEAINYGAFALDD